MGQGKAPSVDTDLSGLTGLPDLAGLTDLTELTGLSDLTDSMVSFFLTMRTFDSALHLEIWIKIAN